MLAIPKAMLDALDLGPEAAVGLRSRPGGSLSIRNGGDAIRWRIAGECKPSARRSREERDWLAGRPAGRELI